VHPNEYTHYVVSRDAKTQQLKMYVDGESKVEFTDKFDQGVIDDDGVLNFFFDDLIVKEEASEGAVAMIKMYDYVVDPATIKRGFLLLDEGITKSITVKTPPVITPELPAATPPSAPPMAEKSKSYTNFEEKTVAIGTSIVLNNIRFVQSKAELLPESDAELNHLWTFMREHPTAEIELQGHTDNQGDFDLNLALSKQRVEAVKAFLVSKGIAAQRISGRGFGSTRPIANNNREETRRLNRRVELVIKKI
jgi:outer membrane protein OmpA-like peptidoglycan-associated protein